MDKALQIWIKMFPFFFLLIVNSTRGQQNDGIYVIPVRKEIGVPVGTVIDWWRPDSLWPIPDGYQICDGRAVNDSRSPLTGKMLPDLTDTFILGVTDTAHIGETGGSSTHDHDVNINHNHRATPSASSGFHQHSDNPPNQNTSSTGSHSHSIDMPAVGTTTAAAHSHSVDLPDLGTTNKSSSTELNLPPF